MRAVCWTLLLTGCAAAPLQPYVPTTQHWPVVPQLQAVTQPPTAAHAPHGLWSRFHSPELQALLETAEQRSFDNLAASARSAQREALLRVARAPLFPSLGLELALTAQSANSKSLGSISGGFFDAGFAGGYDLDVWGEKRQHVASARAESEASDYDRAATARLVAMSVANAYFEVLSLRERGARARENLAATRRVLEIVEARARAGSALAREVSQQAALVAAESVLLEQLARAESEALVTLALATGVEPAALSVRARDLALVQEPAFSAAELGVPAQILAHRPDVARAERELAASHADVAAARAALLPQLRLSGAIGLQTTFLSKYDSGEGGSDARGSYNGSSLVYVGAVSLSQPLFDGGERSARADAAAARRREAEANYRRTALQAVAEVDQALRSLTTLQRQYEQQQHVVDEAQRAFKLTELEYQSGAEDLLAVLDAQRVLFRAEDDFSQLRFVKLRAAVTLIHALGGTSSRENRTP